MSLDDLQRQRSRLASRLEEGHRRIEAALAGGQDVTAWEEFWMALLHEYEDVCQELERDPVSTSQPELFPINRMNRSSH